jgi:hypothetical protein
MQAYRPETTKSISNLAERFNEICRLDGEEALCVLRRRYHIIKLCEAQRDEFRENNWMVLDTSSTFQVARRAQRGNPTANEEAAITTAIASTVDPVLEKDSREFRKLRDRIKRLRKLAQNLRMLVDTYGLGILALIPSGPSFPDMPLTDTASVSRSR